VLTDIRRIMSAALCTVLSAAMLCSCTSGSSEKTETAETAQAEQTTDSADSKEISQEASDDVSFPEIILPAPETEQVQTTLPDTTETAAPQAPAEPRLYGASELSQYSVGRTLLQDDVLYFNHSCSGLRFDFCGTSLKAELVSSAEYCYDELHRAWVAVYLDDSIEPYCRFPLDSERATYQLFESEQPVEAQITIVKLTEQQFGTAGITSLEAGVGDTLDIVPLTDGYIEFFGDSITAGYGNEGELSHGFDTSEENGYLTYASIAARELGVDYSMICVSGMGLTDSRTCDYVASDIYPKTDVFLSDEEYSFSRKPQLVVVNLGANDSYYINLDDSYYELYENRYYELLAQIRQKNPDAVILCCICDYWQSRLPQIERAIERFSAETGDDKIHSLLLPYVTKEEDYGSDAHPKICVQYEIADVLIGKIKELGAF